MRTPVLLCALALAAAAGCSGDKTPPRDQIPALREAVYQLQERVKAHHLAALDSLLSVKILDRRQSGDSLLSFVYGPERSFAFEQFGGCEIAYTRDHAVAECWIMDTTHARTRPIRLEFARDGDRWLLASFGTGAAAVDSTPPDSAARP